MSFEQPYKSNPQCHFESVPLTDTEKRALKLRMMPWTVMLAVVSGGGFILQLNLVHADFGSSSLSEYIALTVFGIIFVLSVIRFFEPHHQKEIFISKLTQKIRYRGKKLYFEDCIGGSVLIRNSIHFPDLEVGEKYRIHKIAGKDIVIDLEKIEV